MMGLRGPEQEALGLSQEDVYVGGKDWSLPDSGSRR